MDAPVTTAHTGFRGLLDAFVEFGLFVAVRLVVTGRAFRLQHTTSTPDADEPNRAQIINLLPATGRPQRLRLITFCSIALSRARDRSATKRYSLVFSSSSILIRFIPEGISPPYFLRQL